MATIATIDYALMAGASYISTRADINQLPAPNGWLEVVDERRALPSGFEATYFTKGTDIVISFAGTGPGWSDWIHGNTPLALGNICDQLKQAADYYLQVKASAPAGATISLTGHSLGGGLASLMAVFFGESATTFDQAPFRKSALIYTTTDVNGNHVTHSVAQDLLTYLTSETANGQPVYSTTQLQKLTDFVNALSAAPAGTVPNEGNVTDINVHGEVLSYLSFSRIGTQTDVWQQNNMSGLFDPTINLHSQALLTAFLQSGDLPSATNPATTPPPHTLGQASYKLLDLLKMIFDPKLFAYPTDKSNDKNTNLLEHLVQQQAAVTDPATGMVTRFNNDLWKLAQDGGLTMHDGNPSNADLNEVSKTLIAFAMQKYYEEQTAGSTLFSDVSGGGGIHFDLADVSQKFKTAFDNHEKLNLTDAKGFDQYFKYYLQQTHVFTPEEHQLIKSLLPYMRDWYVQAGANGMNAADTLNRGAFMLGGNGSDALLGGTGADLLVGNAGNDILVGGQGNDTLLGGSGNDAYVYTTGDGLDTILDTGGQNTLAVDGTVLAGGAQYGDAHVHRDANKHLYVDVGQGNLIIDGNILIQNYGTGGTFGLTMTGLLADTGLTTLTGNASDNFIGMDVYTRDPNDSHIEKATNSNGQTWAGSSNIIGSNADILEGGAGSDIIVGGATGGSRIYADTRIDAATAIANGNSDASINARGDWLAGSDGDDTLVGSASNDVLLGGGGSDLLIGGAGADYIMGDVNAVATRFDWALTNINGTESFYPTLVLPAAAGGADVIYAGKGDDHVWGGAGNDVIFGESGNDIVQAAKAEMAKTTNGAICAVLFGRAKPEAANDSMLLAA